MTPNERAYRDLWMAEMWAPVPEWHAARLRPVRATTRIEARRQCPVCHIAYSPDYLRHHRRRMHPEAA